MWEVEEVRHVRVFAPPTGCALCQAVRPHPTMSILRSAFANNLVHTLPHRHTLPAGLA